MRIAWILIIWILSSTVVTGEGVLEGVRALELDQVDGPVPTFHSAGYVSRAGDLSRLLGPSVSFFESEFAVDETWTLAVLAESDWVKVTDIPYGLPFVSGPPFIVCIPASSDHLLGRILSRAISADSLDDHFSLSVAGLTDRFVSLIGFHELGHIYARRWALEAPSKWTFELAATYFAYSYLAAHQPGENRVWREVSRSLRQEIRPETTALKDFEELYVGVGVENYTWFQVVFLERVADVYARQGTAFLRKWKDVGLPQSGILAQMDRLEEVCPGFHAWAERFGLIASLERSAETRGPERP